MAVLHALVLAAAVCQPFQFERTKVNEQESIERLLLTDRGVVGFLSVPPKSVNKKWVYSEKLIIWPIKDKARGRVLATTQLYPYSGWFRQGANWFNIDNGAQLGPRGNIPAKPKKFASSIQASSSLSGDRLADWSPWEKFITLYQGDSVTKIPIFVKGDREPSYRDFSFNVSWIFLDQNRIMFTKSSKGKDSPHSDYFVVSISKNGERKTYPTPKNITVPGQVVPYRDSATLVVDSSYARNDTMLMDLASGKILWKSNEWGRPSLSADGSHVLLADGADVFFLRADTGCFVAAIKGVSKAIWVGPRTAAYVDNKKEVLRLKSMPQ